MPEIRQNIVTKDWIIFATERAKRPEDFKKHFAKKEEKPDFSPNCPFCPGNENKTPPAILEIKKDNAWIIRVIPNKFSALVNEGIPQRKTSGIKRIINGVGVHEVIIETPAHNSTTGLMEEENVREIIQVYKKRYLDLEKDSRLSQIIIFKNHGKSAGTSLEHPHSQLIATPIVPASVRQRFEEAMRHYDENGVCVFCQMIEEEIKDQERLILEDDKFLAIIPYAAYSPFHIWILPKRHSASFGEINQEEIKSLAGILKNTLAKLYYGLDDPDYNYCIRSTSIDQKEVKYFHWYLAIVPKVTKIAGFELGSGMFINVSMPEESAKFLRELKI
ncbi:MAG: galactose-1-phosphate uridylyltransferase [Armatimonadetes bacterium]|nr:galactose-1-phosphate uridylyltransferase [Armatimonadota bacterium]